MRTADIMVATISLRTFAHDVGTTTVAAAQARRSSVSPKPPARPAAARHTSSNHRTIGATAARHASSQPQQLPVAKPRDLCAVRALQSQASGGNEAGPRTCRRTETAQPFGSACNFCQALHPAAASNPPPVRSSRSIVSAEEDRRHTDLVVLELQ
eukprot:NODE_8531_length_1489_cov_2.969897.p1 GENE.NODE_8531_length_1489_cov_2.969897~~NODE_8531_length_1489_cov_2.969897.p1  ORF type:complete len:155 (-),score=19.06 NODE_8531_length_1489_cov_2.969897:446-910(-)